MKLYDNEEMLLVSPVNDIDKIKVMKYRKNSMVVSIEGKGFLVVKRSFCNKFMLSTQGILNFEYFNVEIKKNDKFLSDFASISDSFGGDGSVIIDMQGISNFIYARSLEFYDYDIRKILIKLNIVKPNAVYLRIGASGGKKDFKHPGGEVIEYSIINGEDGSGVSQNISGYLPENEQYSKSIKLNDTDKVTLKEERVVYSHTAILKKCNASESKSMHFRILIKNGKQSLLDSITTITERLNLKSYAIQIMVKNKNGSKNKTSITGRVLKDIPHKAFDILQEATDIAIEKTFTLEDSQFMFGVGTKYDRWEPEWTEFTNGRIYERRGHIHGTIIGKENLYQQHKAFHLRDILISRESNVEVIITPIEDTYRVYPIFKNNGRYYCKATLKNIDTIIDNIPL